MLLGVTSSSCVGATGVHLYRFALRVKRGLLRGALTPSPVSMCGWWEAVGICEGLNSPTCPLWGSGGRFLSSCSMAGEWLWTPALSRLLLELLCWIPLSVLCFAAQGSPFHNMLLWVLAVSFQFFLGHQCLAYQCEQILGNPCCDLSSCCICFVCVFLILRHHFKTKDCFTRAYCHGMQQWKLALQKESLCG